MNWTLAFCHSAIALAVFATALPIQAQSPQTEVRALYVHPSSQWKQESVEDRRQAMIAFLDKCDRANINLLRMWIESCHIAALLGEPNYRDLNWNGCDLWDSREWDVVQELIDHAEARGIEVHFWYSFTRYKRDRRYVPEYDPNLQILPPGNPDWASVTKSEYQAGHTDPSDPKVSGGALCNNEFSAHDWTLKVVDMVFQRYPGLGGFDIEEPGYLNLERCVCYRCQRVYEQLYIEPGENLLQHIHSDLKEYRADTKAIGVKSLGTNRFVVRLIDWMQQVYPNKIISTGGGTDVLSERARGRNWYEWTHWGSIRYWGNQAYRPTLDSFGRDVEDAMEALAGSGCHFIPIVAIRSNSVENSPETVAQQIQAARALDGHSGVDLMGVGLFAGAYLTDAHADALRQGPFKQKARLPWRED